MIRKLMSNDLALKIISVIVAVGVWIYVVNIENPELDLTYRSIAVASVNKETIINNNLAVVSYSSQKVDVKVKGRRNQILAIDTNLIKATIDMSVCVVPGTYTLPIKVEMPNTEITVLEVTPSNVNVTVDSITSVEKDVSINIIGKPKEGYIAGIPVPDPQKIQITGPRELVASIFTAEANISVEGLDNMYSGEHMIILRNNNGAIINDANKVLTISHPNIYISCPIYKTITVGVLPVWSEEILKSYNLQNISVEPENIIIYGSDTLLANIQKLRTNQIKIAELVEGANRISADIVLDENIYAADGVDKVTISVNAIKRITPDN